ncbi:MAG: pantoate--beta-alanine ligase [Acidimicrobiales bacterium]
MQVIDSTESLAKALAARRGAGMARPPLGLVPTMGALHAGHLSLAAAARSQCDTVVLSVFVNPTQFGPDEDLDTYPRDLDGDASKAEAAGVDILFAPSTAEMHPGQMAPPAALYGMLEGARRHGHFQGVATVVAKLFDLVRPERAYFGEKDYQQVLVVRHLVAEGPFPVEIVACPTVREPDGLALSSRNARLTPPERQAARVLYQALLAGRAAIEGGGREPEAATASMAATLDQEPLARLDYAAVVQPNDLAPALPPLRGELRLLVAAHVGAVRLIDNMGAQAG